MSSLCLSSVLTHANLTMYQTGGVDALEDQPNLYNLLPSSGNLQAPNSTYSSSLTGLWYKQISPHYWTLENVLEWISDHIDRIKFDAAHLSLAYCTVDGPTLCHMTHEQMVGLFGPQLGPELHQSLLDHKTKHELQNLSGTDLNETCQLLDNFLDNLSFPFLSSLKVGEACDDKKEFNYDLAQLTMDPMISLRETDYLSDSEYSSSPPGCTFGIHIPSSPESGSSESDPEFSFPQIAKEQIKTEKEEFRAKRPRGRPPKLTREQGEGFYENPKKSKHAPRGTHLWEFIRDILIHPEKNQGLMKWEDRQEGVFKFLKSEAVAQMWGQKKKNSSMTYEKLSRAMRYYYKREILERVDGRRLVYKFGKNSRGWQTEDVSMVIQGLRRQEV